jgi:poly [ADP-ribose] polymerase
MIPFKEVPNHLLLYHGSSITNFIGILSEGLRIAPKEAPTTGYAFGKGVYFADMFDKSFAYCQRGGSDEGFLMLMCEVALGNSQTFNHFNYVDDLNEELYQSVKGLG